MLNAQESLLLGVTLSSTGLSLVHTLQTELNVFVKSFQQSTIDFKSVSIEHIQNLFQLVRHKLKGRLQEEDFTKQFNKWSKAKGSIYKSSKDIEIDQRNVYSIEDILVALRTLSFHDSTQYTSFLSAVVEMMSREYSTFLTNTSNVGIVYKGTAIQTVDMEAIYMMDQIFSIFDYKGTGNLQIDRLFFLYLALLQCQPNPSFHVNKSTFVQDLNSSFGRFLEQISCFHGRVTSRQLKMYLLYHKLTTKPILQNLYQASRMVSEFGQRISEELQQSSEVLFPNLLALAIKRTLPKANLSDLRTNTLDIQLICHFLLMNFLTYVQDYGHLNGLMPIKKKEFSKIFLKHFYNYYSLSRDTMFVHSQVMSTFYNVNHNYAQLAVEILQKTQHWLISTNWPLNAKFSFTMSKKPSRSSSKSPNPSNNHTRHKRIKTEFEDDLHPNALNIDIVEFSKVKQNSNASSDLKSNKHKSSLVNDSIELHLKERNSSVSAAKGGLGHENSLKATKERSRGSTREGSKHPGNSISNNSISSLLLTSPDQLKEVAKQGQEEEEKHSKQQSNERKQSEHRERDKAVDKSSHNKDATKKDESPQLEPYSFEEMIDAAPSLGDEDLNFFKSDGRMKTNFQDFETMRNQIRKAWGYQKAVLEQVSKGGATKSFMDTSLERVREATNSPNQGVKPQAVSRKPRGSVDMVERFFGSNNQEKQDLQKKSSSRTRLKTVTEKSKSPDLYETLRNRDRRESRRLQGNKT